MENKDIFIKDLKEAIGEDNIKLLTDFLWEKWVSDLGRKSNIFFTIYIRYHIQYKYIK